MCACFYCCRLTGRCGGSEPSNKGYTRDEVCGAGVILAFGICLVIAGTVLGFIANYVAAEGMRNSEASLTQGLNDLSAIPSIYLSTFDPVPQQINASAQALLNSIAQLPPGYLGTSGEFGVLVANITGLLRNTGSSFSELISTAQQIVSLTPAISHVFFSSLPFPFFHFFFAGCDLLLLLFSQAVVWSDIVVSYNALSDALSDVSARINDLKQPMESSTQGECMLPGSFSFFLPLHRTSLRCAQTSA